MDKLRPGDIAPRDFEQIIKEGKLGKIGMVEVWPLATIVQVSFLSPKSFGTGIVKTPHWRRGTKCVGWP